MRGMILVTASLVVSTALLPKPGPQIQSKEGEEEKAEAEIKLRVEKQVRAALAQRWSRDKKILEERMEVLRREIERLDAAVGLSDEQRRRLELAAKGTVRRFTKSMNQVQVIEQDRSGYRVTLRENVGSLEGVWPGEGLIQAESIWTKAVASTLSEQQLAEHRKQAAARKVYLTNARVQTLVASLDTELWLTDEQREDMEHMLRRELGVSLARTLSSPDERAYFESRAVAIENEQFEAILSAKQMELLEKLAMASWWDRANRGGMGGGGGFGAGGLGGGGGFGGGGLGGGGLF